MHSSTLLEFGTSSCKFFILSEIFSLRSCEIHEHSTQIKPQYFLDGSVKIQSFRQRKKKGSLTLSAMLCGSVAWPRRALTRGFGAPFPAAPLPFATSGRVMKGGAFSPILPLLTSLDCTCGEEGRAGSIQANFGTKSILNSNQQRQERYKTCSGLCVAPVALNDESCCPERFR
jgi:hypothetical protein